MLKSYEELSPIAIDCLKEIGNIGSSYAASSMSTMLSKSVEMHVPEVRLMDFQSVIDEMGGPEKVIAGILVDLSGDIEGMIMFLLEESFTKIVLDTLMGRQHINLTELDEADISAIIEMGNIMAGSYIGAISSLSGLSVKMAVPSMTVDMMGAVMDLPIIEFSKVGDKVLFIDDGFIIDNIDIKSNIILVPTVESLDILMKKLGVSND